MPISSNRRKVIVLGLLTGLLYVTQLCAQNRTPEADPVRIKRLLPYLQTPNLIGQGKYTYWGFDVYNASLWTSEATIAPDQWANQRIALELQYLRDFKGSDIAKRSIDEIQAQSALPKNKASIWLKTMDVWAKANLSLEFLFLTRVRSFFLTTPLSAKSKILN